MGRGIARQILNVTPGMQLVAIANRTLEKAAIAFQEAGADTITSVDSVAQLDEAVATGRYSITDNPALLCQAEGIDVVLEVTGDVEFGAHVALEAIEHSKHVVLMNAELDATIGPILKTYADRARVVVTDADGDQPAVIMNLFRFVSTIGYQPVLAGNIKGLLDHYRTPETQQAFADKFNLSPNMATSFADGTKIAMEMAVVANATGFRVGKRGMYGPSCANVKEAQSLFPLDEMLDGGLVDYVLGAEPGPGVFVLGYNDRAIERHYLTSLRMGEGPLYVFYIPYHLCHLEVPITAARAVLFQDAAVTPIGSPVCEVITVAKRDLKKGEVLDGIGGFTCYGLLENSDITRAENLLPMGLCHGARLISDIPKDQPVAYGAVAMPEGRLCDKLRAEQDSYFPQAAVIS